MNGRPAILPTPAEAYSIAQYKYPLFEEMPIVRIPIQGPAPFNMLAYVRTLVFGVDFGWDNTDTLRRTVTFQTTLSVRGFDPNGDAIPVQHSSMGVLRMMQSDRSLDIQMALDAVHPDSRFDDFGRWEVTVDLADREDSGLVSAAFELSSWVMFHEPAADPGAPPPTNPDVSTTTLAAHAIQLQETYQQYLASPGANVPAAAEELTRLSGQLAVPPTFADAVAPQQLALDALSAYMPPPGGQLLYLIELNEARHNLIVRLRDAQEYPPAVALASSTVAGYREYATEQGADLPRVQRDLAELVKPLIVIGAPTQALDATRAALEVLQRIVPDAGSALDHEIEVAEAQHNLVARLLDNHLEDEARQLAATTIRAYVDYAHKPNATVSRAIADLEEFSGHVLTPGGLTELATQAHAAAVALGG